MKQLAVALFTLPDDRLVFQRRTDDAPVNAGLIGFFGGHVEEGESNDDAIVRELKEETSLLVDDLVITHEESFTVEREGEQVRYHLYQIPLQSADFKVYEGQRADAYSEEELVKRTDLTSSVKYVVERLTRR